MITLDMVYIVLILPYMPDKVPKHYRKISNKGLAKRTPGFQEHGALARLLWTVHMQGVQRKGLECTISMDRFWELSGQSCHYCGGAPYERAYAGGGHANGVDRLDSSIGYVDGNVVAACKTCNGMKSGLSVAAFVEACRRVWLHAGGNSR